MEDSYTNDKSAGVWWSRSRRWWQRMLSNQVSIRMAYFDTIANEWTGLDALDIGCAGGYMAETLAKRGARVSAIDPWGAVLNVAHVHALASEFDVTYIVGLGELLPIASGSLDRVVCVDVLEHVEDLPRVLSEIRRVLRPGGILLFDTIDRTWLSRLLVVTLAEKAIRIVPRGTHEYMKLIRPAELKALLQTLEFRVGPMTGMGIALGIDRRIDRLLSKLLSSGVMYAGYAVRT